MTNVKYLLDGAQNEDMPRGRPTLGEDPVRRKALVQVARCCRALEQAETKWRDKLNTAVADAREAGATWQEIADEMGTTRQGAQRRFGGR